LDHLLWRHSQKIKDHICYADNSYIVTIDNNSDYAINRVEMVSKALELEILSSKVSVKKSGSYKFGFMVPSKGAGLRHHKDCGCLSQ